MRIKVSNVHDILAAYYQRLMAQVDYVKWTDLICAHLSGKKTGIDFGCGTGAFTLELNKRGYNMTAVDISAAMLNIAMHNALGRNIDFIQCDIQKFKSCKTFDFAIAMCDVVNYLKKPQEFFKNAYASLNQNGVLIFDIKTEEFFKGQLKGNIICEEDDFTLIWQNKLCHDKVLMDLIFFEKTGDEYYVKNSEYLTQYIYTDLQIKQYLKACGFKRIKTKIKSQRSHYFAFKD